jgi:pimeloyl-ACP methyl ester carboxylesterase
VHPILTKALDRLVIRMAAAALPKPGRFEARMAEATAMLQRPDFFSGAIGNRADLKMISGSEFEFASAIRTGWTEMDLARGKLVRAGEDWKSRATVVLLHGWNDELGYRFRSPYQARLLRRAGLNTVLLEFPCHLHRRCKQPGSAGDFISEDLLQTVQAARQSIADASSVVNWLKSRGVPQVGIWGVSLGGWIGGLLACHDPELDFAVLTTPITRMDRVIAELEFCAAIRHSLQAGSMDLALFNLKSHRPKLAPDRILIVEAEDDLFAFKETVEELWESWGRPDIHRLRHGHISVLMSQPAVKQGVRWIVEQAGRGRQARPS